MRLTTLKPTLQRLPASRIGQPAGIERKRGTTGVNDRNQIRARDKGLCQECMRSGLVTLGAEVDHIIPLHMGGSDEASNKQLLCRACHAAKTATEAKQRAGVV